MAKRPVYHYQYWSKRLTGELAGEVGINIRPRWLMNVSALTKGVGIGAQQRDYSLRLDEVAAKLEASGVLLPFAGAEPSVRTPYFLSGSSQQMKLMLSWVGTTEHRGAVCYASLAVPDGLTTHLCFFGGIDNFIGYTAAQRQEADWASSAWAAIQELIDSRGAANSHQWDNEARAFEAAKWARDSGGGSPRNVFEVLEYADWCAQIYADVIPTPGRWLGGWERETGRILVGAPLWIRTTLPRNRKR